MSKIGGEYLELQEQANELGYASVQEAIDDGYVACLHENGKSVLEKHDDAKPADGQEEAHKAWLEEKKAVLEELENLHDYFVEEDDLHYSIVVAKAIKFIKEGEC